MHPRPNVAYAVFHCSKGRGLIVNSIGTKRKIQLSVISLGMHRWKMRSNNIKYRAGLDRKPLYNSFMYFFSVYEYEECANRRKSQAM